ncbi:hypothetical protein DPMN_068705 [Dreissena polymorpha]|uniref:Uncharacterized protein n=1 Tax=Dreissena polymorpha TaxID=45954 RepID=A0A9D3YY31_DREPO|nr:hypothetical protein DPMN_068705 [Dreissena polymorpha]
MVAWSRREAFYSRTPGIQGSVVRTLLRTNLLTKCHEDWAINVASRVLTRFYYSHIWKNAPPPGDYFHEDWTINVASRVKNAPTHDSHVFQANVTVLKLIQDIIGTNLLTKFHEDQKINVASRENALPPGGHVFQPAGIIFEHLIGMDLLTKFHEDWTTNVASRVKNAPPLGSHVFQAMVTIFFHEDRKINVDSRVLTRKNAPPSGSHVF